MKIRCTLLAACMLCLGLAACGDSSLLAPEGPRFDGGYTFGSGNRADTTTTTTPTTPTATGTSAERGGYTFGSGN
jgi:hypothetical protein